MSQERSSQPPAPADPQPQHIQVQHVLVGFAGSVPGARITRSQEQARTLAYDILSQAEQGADFDALVREHTDDSPPGVYGMSNRGAQPDQGEYPRDGMVPAFGNVGFTLGVGGYGVADFDPRTSPYGYHVIKRLK
jgi:parvulin-like peptidyl-prolyl isomerase